MNICKIKIIKGRGADKVYMETDLPEACWPYDGTLSIRFDVAEGRGEEYIKTHFPQIPVHIIQT